MSSSTPTPAETLAAEAVLERELKTVKKAMEHIRRANKVIKRRRYRLKEPSITPGLYGSEPAVQQSALFHLPAEVNHQIWKALPTVADRLSLALTCKAAATIFEDTKDIKLKDGVSYLFPKPKATTKSHRLQVLVRLQSWVPNNFRLCYRCVQYINQKEPINAGQWGGDPHKVRGGLATNKAMLEGPRCPLCIVADNLDMAKHKAAHKKFVQLAYSVHLG